MDNDVCRWQATKDDDDDYTYYATTCRCEVDWEILPKSNNFQYCPYCSKQIVYAPGIVLVTGSKKGTR